MEGAFIVRCFLFLRVPLASHPPGFRVDYGPTRSATRRPHPDTIPVLRQILLHLVVFVLYSLGISVAVFMLPPVTGLAVALVVLWAVLRLYVLRDAGVAGSNRAAALRLRPLATPVLGWVLAAAPVLLLLSWSLGDLYVRLVPVPPQVLNPFGHLVFDPMQRLAIAVVAIALAPVIEEMFFRGLIQYPLEQRWGAMPGIVTASLIFALVHIDTLPWVVPLHLLLGVIFGWVVYVTRSIWAGVILHAVNNSAAFLGLTSEEPEPRSLIWATGMDTEAWWALGALGVSLGSGAWIVRRLWRAAMVT
jgi:membrane protease YdiL (CAAX protease family)